MAAFHKPSLSCLFWLAVVLLVLENIVTATSEIDPYRVLGVSWHASQAEIKKAYKQLAKEWHPDKNKDPSAGEMFIKISKSYEILSSEKRRANYDRFGQTDEQQSSFNYKQSTKHSADSKHLLRYAEYLNNVVPDSFKRPYLIMFTSEWCFPCMYVEPIWKETIQALEPLGVGFGVVDIGYEKSLAKHLGGYIAPSFLGLIDGRVTLFYNAVNQDNLRQFVESLLPQKLVEKVTDDNYVQFLNSWREENKPRVLLFDSMSSSPLFYKLTAFAYRDFVRFGYVPHAEAKHVLQKFSINMYAPTLLLFKENTEKPADSTQSKNMKKQIIDEVVSKNRFLLVPRLVNQKFFDELCPVKQLHHPRKYCVLLITGEDESFVPANAAFFDFASSNTKEVLRFAYVSQKRQQPLCDTLLKKQDVSTPQVIILERRSATGKVFYRTVTGVWNGSGEDKLHLHKQLELLQSDPGFLTNNAMLPELNNELASMFLVRWVYAACDYLSQLYFDLLYSSWREVMPVLSLFFSALFILFGTVIIQAFSDSGDEKSTKRKAKKSTKTSQSSPKDGNPSSHPSENNILEVIELTDVTYSSNLVNLKPGHINVMLVLTDESKEVLLEKYKREVCSFSDSQILQFSFLNADKHNRWMDSLFQLAPDARPTDMQHKGKLDYTGCVLALNGYRRYFCLFTPTSTQDGADLHHKLDQLNLWMEKLTEGTLVRHNVPVWPDLDIGSRR